MSSVYQSSRHLDGWMISSVPSKIRFTTSTHCIRNDFDFQPHTSNHQICRESICFWLPDTWAWAPRHDRAPVLELSSYKARVDRILRQSLQCFREYLHWLAPREFCPTSSLLAQVCLLTLKSPQVLTSMGQIELQVLRLARLHQRNE